MYPLGHKVSDTSSIGMTRGLVVVVAVEKSALPRVMTALTDFAKFRMLLVDD